MKTSENKSNWPILKSYNGKQLLRTALPLGGIGTGSVSLGGRGNLRDWEIMNRPAKGYVPRTGRNIWPSFIAHLRPEGGRPVTRLLEGPIPAEGYEGSHGAMVPNHGLPRFETCSFKAAYPLGMVLLEDEKVPVDVRLEAFNPMIPADADSSGLPLAVLRYVFTNPTQKHIQSTICGTVPNFIGNDGSQFSEDWKGDRCCVGEQSNRNRFRSGESVRGIYMYSDGVPENAEQWGTMALTTCSPGELSYRTAWKSGGWGTPLLDFWDDLTEDGRLDERNSDEDAPPGSLAIEFDLGPRDTEEVTFLLTWHFPNRHTWTPSEDCNDSYNSDRIGNYYTTRYQNAWDVAEKIAPELEKLEQKTVQFVRSFCESGLPGEIKESALFNLSTLRTQTCFRTEDGHFFGWEGCSSQQGCCHGSCTHVWNYEQATPFLYGELARSMREVEFAHATDEKGLMNYRVNLPLERATEHGATAADGQMGCIMKLYRDWQLSGDDDMLRRLWPKARKALEFCWIEGGWDADRDGVMEGCQHNTMDVEYFGPNPQMTGWYLGALRATEEMARYLGENELAGTCRGLFNRGSHWMDENLFNGEYYEHQVLPPRSAGDIDECFYGDKGAEDLLNPDFQLGKGCLVDQLVGQYMAHITGLGHLHDKQKVRKCLESVFEYNFRSMKGHFNCMRTFAAGDEKALLMATYPYERPQNPFPYFNEVMTGFEYTAAVGMLQNGLRGKGLEIIRSIRARYDGTKRNPFDEAECGHHYARAMTSWAAAIAWTGFRYSAVDNHITFDPKDGNFFWSTGDAWGTAQIKNKEEHATSLKLEVLYGSIALKDIEFTGTGQLTLEQTTTLSTGVTAEWTIEKQ